MKSARPAHACANVPGRRTMSAARTIVLAPMAATDARVDDCTLVAPHIVRALFTPSTMPLDT